MTKRIISMLLVLVMVLSIAVVGVSAASTWGGMTDYAEPSLKDGSTNTFIIDTPQKLAWLSRAVEDASVATAFLQKLNPEATAQEARKVFQNYVFEQTADIDLGGKAFMPIGSYMGTTRHLFGGTYNGNGYKIMNAKVSMADHADSANGYYKNTEATAYKAPEPAAAGAAGHYDALFNISAGSVIKNVNAVNVHTGNYDASHTTSTAAGVIVGFMIEATVQDCTTDATSSATATKAAGGMAVVPYGDKGSTIKGCTNNAKIVATEHRAGGIIATTLYAKDTVVDCVNNGAIDGAADGTGGIVGYALSNMVIDGCKNTGSVVGDKETAGICGKMAGTTPVVQNCTNSGNVSSTATTYSARSGGIVGSANNTNQGYTTITNCVNSGAITSAYAGGIVGYIINCDISDCVNSGTIKTTVKNYFAGGIVSQNDNYVAGQVDVAGASKITGCVNTGTILAEDLANTTDIVGAAGIIGMPAAGTTIANCVNRGVVDGGYYAGGIACTAAGVEITFCVNEGEVKVAHNAGGNSVSVGGILGSVSAGDEVKISYCVNKGVISAITNRNMLAGGIVGGPNGNTGGWTTTNTKLNLSYCYNLATDFKQYDNATPSDYRAAGAGMFAGYCNNSSGHTFKMNNCYSVAGKTTVYDASNSEKVGENAFDSSSIAVIKGLVSGIGSQTNFDNSLGAGWEANVSNNGYGLSVAEIEAMSVYKDIIAATPADDSDTINFIGVQDSLIKGDTYDVRFVAGIDTLDYYAAGFMVKISSNAGTMTEAKTFVETQVYTSLVGRVGDTNVVYNAADYDTTYFVALSIEEINLAKHGAVTFEITPVTFATKAAYEAGNADGDHTYVVEYDADGNFVGCARLG